MMVRRSPGLPRGFDFDPRENPQPILLRPLGLLAGVPAREAVATGRGRDLAGGPLAFTGLEMFLAPDREAGVTVVTTTIAEAEDWAASLGSAARAAFEAQLQALSHLRPPFAGLTMDRPRIMGIVNVTPDSFYDGGRRETAEAAVAHGMALIEAGADILDIGGESTRPGSAPVSEAEEMDRVLPVIGRLADSGAVVSVDTRRASVMRAASEAGASIVNDVYALTEPGALEAAVETGMAVALMHMRGRPATMQKDPEYDHAPYEIVRFLVDRVRACEAAGINASRMSVDPGIGFGKTTVHNLEMLAALAFCHASGRPVVLGASRKSFIGAIAATTGPETRLPGTLATLAHAVGQGIQIHRVHDVGEARQALAVAAAIHDLPDG